MQRREGEEEVALALMRGVQVLEREDLGNVGAREEVHERVALGEEEEAYEG